MIEQEILRTDVKRNRISVLETKSNSTSLANETKIYFF